MADQNVHMTHIEELMFFGGVDGTRRAIFFLRDLRDMLKGHMKASVDVTVKWDGAPAVFAGVDPSDGKFFVAKKGIFAKNPKVYKTVADVKADTSGDLAKKLTVAFEEFSKLGIKKGVIQGDLMFTKGDIKKTTIDGEKYFTFQPNTIVYAVPVNSHLGKIIARARIGVVWHTSYAGRNFQSMRASFGKDIAPKLRTVSSVWMDDATYHDVSGKATFTAAESAKFDKLLSHAGKLFNKINGDAFRTIVGDAELRQKVVTFINTYIRSGSSFPSSSKMATDLVNYLSAWYQKEIDKKKSDKGKDAWKAKRDDMVNKVAMHKDQLMAIFDLMQVLVEAKGMVIDQFDKAQSIRTLLRTKNGFVTTKQEGFVAIDHLTGGAVKLVDRLEFSKANFSPEIIKGWEH